MNKTLNYKLRLNLAATLVEYITQLDESKILTKDTVENMALSLASFAEEATLKYIKGQKEHGGHITDRDLNKEIRNEIIDIFWYSTAQSWLK